ncbi:MAG: translation initiation factor IF-2, partial [Petrotogaceae bacterium]|nr:translation initiation factor IF-2 [Petrotogaceae bacterium]
IQVKRYEIIFNLIDDIKKALEGMLEPEEMEAVTGGGYIKELFRIKKVGTIAGIQVTEGYVNKDGSVKLYRNGKFVTQVKIEQLKHYKDDVKSVDAPKECGMKFFNFDDLVVGDELEFLKTVQVERKLEFDEQKENKK